MKVLLGQKPAVVIFDSPVLQSFVNDFLQIYVRAFGNLAQLSESILPLSVPLLMCPDRLQGFLFGQTVGDQIPRCKFLEGFLSKLFSQASQVRCPGPSGSRVR